jgi:hypothetical protein
MAGDNSQVITPGPLAHRSSDVGMRETMKAKPAQTVPLDPLRRKGVRRRADRQSCVESRVEAGNRGQSRVHGPNGSDPSQRAVLMQRRESSERPDPSLDLWINPDGPRIPRSAVNHPVPNRIGLRQSDQRLPHGVWVNSTVWQLQVTAPEDQQPVIEHAQPQRTRAGIHD